jgi:hypothetical protein
MEKNRPKDDKNNIEKEMCNTNMLFNKILYYIL